METKRCSACGETKALSEFWKKPGGRYGVTARCIPCHSVYMREWRKNRSVVVPKAEKTCPRCGVTKPMAEFGDREPSLRPYCLVCAREYNNERAKRQASSVPAGATKACPRCKTTKPVAEFFRNKHNPDGLAAYCKPCWKTYLKEHEDPVGRQRRQIAYGLKRFGLTPADYENMLSEQGGVCAICRGACFTGKRLAVDHDETTGRVRGLLCVRCNQGIGRFEHDPEMLMSAANYLKTQA